MRYKFFIVEFFSSLFYIIFMRWLFFLPFFFAVSDEKFYKIGYLRVPKSQLNSLSKFSKIGCSSEAHLLFLLRMGYFLKPKPNINFSQLVMISEHYLRSAFFKYSLFFDFNAVIPGKIKVYEWVFKFDNDATVALDNAKKAYKLVASGKFQEALELSDSIAYDIGEIVPYKGYPVESNWLYIKVDSQASCVRLIFVCKPESINYNPLVKSAIDFWVFKFFPWDECEC